MTKKEYPKRNKKSKRKSKLNLEGIPSSDLKMKYYKKKREQKRIKTTIFKAHTLLKIFLVFFLLWCSSRLMICKLWYLPQNLFDKYPSKNLLIRGNRITPNDKIIAALKQTPIENKPIYMINTMPYEKEIEKLSPVKKAFVRRYWLPARFEITIEEKVPVLTISPNPNAPEIAAITADGSVISKEYLPINEKKYKTYKILTYDDYSQWTPHEIQSLETLTERIEDFSEEKLIYLDIRNKHDVYAQLGSIKIRIGELNSTLKARIERLNSIMPQIENLKRQTDYVDIRWDNTTYLKKKSKTPVLSVKKTEQNKDVNTNNSSNNTRKPEAKTTTNVIKTKDATIQAKPVIKSSKKDTTNVQPETLIKNKVVEP